MKRNIITIDEDNKKITMKFEKKKEFKKVYKLLNDIFFGDFLKKMIETMMKAFQGFASNLGDAFGGMGDAFGGMEPPEPPGPSDLPETPEDSDEE